jgi:hypothetical protein
MMLLLLLMLFVLLLFIMMCIYLLLSDEVYLCNTDRVLSSTQSVCCVVFDNKRNKDVNFGRGFEIPYYTYEYYYYLVLMLLLLIKK